MTARVSTIVIVGQVPPPFGGQAVMVEALIRGSYASIALHHVRMNFSRSFSERKKLSVRKIAEVFRVVFRIWRCRIQHRADSLYFPPSGPDLIPVLRDLAILVATRWMFRRTIFHFHACGLSEIYDQLPRYLKPFYWWAYRSPDLAVCTSKFTTGDAEALGAKRIVKVPNGVEDCGAQWISARSKRDDGHPPCVLFVGLVCETKGVSVLLEAAAMLTKKRLDFRVVIVGEPDSPEYGQKLYSYTKDAGLESYVSFTGPLAGQRKQEVFAEADVLCFPSFFQAESFGLVLIEAFSFGIPVVATSWRGIREVVEDGVNGFLVPTRDPTAVANALEKLLRDADLRDKLGRAGREAFITKYTVDRFRERMEMVLNEKFLAK